MNRARTYAISAVTLLALDLLWLGVIAPPLYKMTIGPLLLEQPNIPAAVLFYLIYLVGVNELVIHTMPAGATRGRTALRGALFGFVAYATFDLTAMAVLKGWSPLIVVVDMAWGTALTAVAAAAGFSGGPAGRKK